MNNIVAAIILISITTLGAATLYHYRSSLTIDTQPLSLERIGQYNRTHDLAYVTSGCLHDVLAYDSATGSFQRVREACAGSLVLIPRSTSP